MFIVWMLWSGYVLMSEIAAKLWGWICRSVLGLSLVKARIHADWFHPSTVYSYDIWSCYWIWLLLQSYVVCSVFWWLCCWQGFSIGWFRDWWCRLYCNGDCFMDPVWKCMKRGPWMIVGRHLRTGKHIGQYKSQGVVAPFQEQLENEWRLEPSVGQRLRTSKWNG